MGWVGWVGGRGEVGVGWGEGELCLSLQGSDNIMQYISLAC